MWSEDRTPKGIGDLGTALSTTSHHLNLWSEDRTPKGIGDAIPCGVISPRGFSWSEDRTPKGIGDSGPMTTTSWAVEICGQKTERRKALVTKQLLSLFLFPQLSWSEDRTPKGIGDLLLLSPSVPPVLRGQKTERRKVLVTRCCGACTSTPATGGQKTERRKVLVTGNVSNYTIDLFG